MEFKEKNGWAGNARIAPQKVSEDEILYVSARIQKALWKMVFVVSGIIAVIGYAAMLWTGVPSSMVLTVCAIGYGTFAGSCISGIQSGAMENPGGTSQSLYIHSLRVLGFGMYFLWMFSNVQGLEPLASEYVLIPIVLEIFLMLSWAWTNNRRTPRCDALRRSEQGFSGGVSFLTMPVSRSGWEHRNLFQFLWFEIGWRNVFLTVSMMGQLFLIHRGMPYVSLLLAVLTVAVSAYGQDDEQCKFRRTEDYRNGSVWIQKGMVFVDVVFLTAALTRFLIVSDERVFPTGWVLSAIPFAILFVGSVLFVCMSGIRLESFVSSFYRIGAEKNFYKHRSEMDSMTDLYNKASLMSFLDSKCRESEFSGIPFGFLMLDIDRFKSFNDKYGHSEGDQAIIFISRILRSVVRGKDLCARYGGEEFSAIVDDGDPMTASLLLSERIRSHVEIKSRGFFEEKRKQALSISKLKRVSGQYDPSKDTPPDFPESLSVSVGFTIWRNGDSPESVIRRADAALYKAKESGRNCIFMCIGHKDEIYPVGRKGTTMMSDVISPSAPVDAGPALGNNSK